MLCVTECYMAQLMDTIKELTTRIENLTIDVEVLHRCVKLKGETINRLVKENDKLRDTVSRVRTVLS